MISVERFIILCFLTQVSIGLSYAQSKDQDDTTTKPTDYEINSQENKIEDGPFFFKINAKRNKPFTLPILEIPNFDGFDQKTAWQIYNNEKTSKVEESQRNDEQKDRVDEFMKADDIILNDSTPTKMSDDDQTSPERNYDETSRSENMSSSTIIPDDQLTTADSTSSTSEETFVKPIHRSTYIYFYKPIDSSRTSGTSSTPQEDEAKDYTGMDHNAFSSLGFGYPFLDNIFSIPGSNIRLQATPKIHHTQHVKEDDQQHNHGLSSLGFGYPFINNFHSFLDERPIKRAVTKVKIFSTNLEDDQPMEQDATSRSNEDVKDKESIRQDEIKDDKVQKSTGEHENVKEEMTLTKNEEHQEKSANVEEILSSIMPIYDWATSSLLNINMNQDILNIGNILRNSYYGSLAKVTEKKEEESQHPPPDVLPDVERDYKNDNPEPRSFIGEVLDEINEESESNRELNIERPPTDKDLPDIGSEDPKTIKPRSPAKCVCGFSQGNTNSCSCFPETLVYYQYCSVPIPPTD